MNTLGLSSERALPISYVSPPICDTDVATGSTEVVLIPTLPDTTPTGFVWEAVGEGYRFSWGAVSGAACYNVYFTPEGSSTPQLLHSCITEPEFGGPGETPPGEYEVCSISGDGTTCDTTRITVTPVNRISYGMRISDDWELPDGRCGTPYAKTFHSELTGNVTPLPPGLTRAWLPDRDLSAGIAIDPLTGLLEGTPTEPAEQGASTRNDFYLRADGSFRVAGDSRLQRAWASAPFRLTILPPFEITTASPLPDLPWAGAYDEDIFVANKLGDVLWELDEEVGVGELPPGLALSETSSQLCKISGTLFTEAFDFIDVTEDHDWTFGLKVTDDYDTTQKTFTIKLLAEGCGDPQSAVTFQGSLPFPDDESSFMSAFHGWTAKDFSGTLYWSAAGAQFVGAVENFSGLVLRHYEATLKDISGVWTLSLVAGADGIEYDSESSVGVEGRLYLAYTGTCHRGYFSYKPDSLLHTKRYLNGSDPIAIPETYPLPDGVRWTRNGDGTPLAITTATPLPEATDGETYGVLLAAAGTNPDAKHWTVVSGTLPAGMSLSDGGLLSADSPLALGNSSVANYYFRIGVSAGDESDVKDFALAVNPAEAPAASVLPSNPALSATVGMAFSQTFSLSGSGPEESWSLDGGAGWFEVDVGGCVFYPYYCDTITIFGTPDAAGVHVFTLTNGSATRTYTLTVT